MSPDLAPATRLVAGGRPPREAGAPVSPAIELTSTYVMGGALDYARSDNATWAAFESTLGDLEGGSALAYASGMAAVSAALSLVPDGGIVVAPRHAYNGTSALLDQLSAAGRVRVRRVALDDNEATCEALRGAALLWAESPTNPMMEVADLPALFAAAQEAGALSVCDNTFCTPLLQRPLELGADVVVHSATKYLSGHADVLLGAAVVANDDLRQLLHTHRTLNGAIPGPFETWLTLRGLRTLHLRLERACSNAATLATRLTEHPRVERVRYPGLGAMLAIEVGSRAAAERVERAVRVWTPATSLGGVESLIERRRRIPAEPTTVPESLLRLSVGVEDVEDLWRDLDQALLA